MTCWNVPADNPLHICNATVGQLVAAYPGLVDLWRLLLVGSVVAALGICAAVSLASWRRRQVERREASRRPAPPVRYARGVVPARRHEDARPRGRVYPAAWSEQTVELRREPAGGEADEEPWSAPLQPATSSVMC